jgi:chitinase
MEKPIVFNLIRKAINGKVIIYELLKANNNLSQLIYSFITNRYIQITKYPIYLFLLCMPLLVSSCNSVKESVKKKNNDAGIKSDSDFKVIGYFMPGHDGKNRVASIPYQYLTSINYCCAMRSPDNSSILMPLSNPDILNLLVTNAHAHGVKIFITVGVDGSGGPGMDIAFANSEVARISIVHSVTKMVRQFNLDGVDIDWEFPDPVEPQATDFVLLMKQLADSLHKTGKKLSAAVESYHSPYGYGVREEVFRIADWFNIMGYDEDIGFNLLTPHSPFWLAVKSFDYWVTKRGMPKEKAVMGVPFYGKDAEHKYHSYRDLLARGADPYADLYDSVYYNGIKTIQQKIKLAKKRGAGIMIWEISEDTIGQYSLLKAIHDAIQ